MPSRLLVPCRAIVGRRLRWRAGCQGALTAMSLAVAAMTAAAWGAATRADEAPGNRKPHVVFVIGEDEYKSEQTLPPIAQELEGRHGMRCTVLTSQPDPKNAKNIPGLDALASADLAVFYVRFRQLPEDQLNHILSYANSGKPVVALRTSTHAFRYPKGSAFEQWNDRFGLEILGQKWIHHYGHDSSTDVSVIPEAAEHPILTGVAKEFHCRSWLYFVQPIPTSARPLLEGTSVGGSYKGKRVVNPVAWTWEPKGGRVFYTSLGHPEDFKVEPFRRLLFNGMYWALGKPVPANRP